MAGTPHGTHSIVIDTALKLTNIRDEFVAIVKALDSLEADGVCTRISCWWGTGGTGFDFSDEADPPGNNAFVVYRWNANAGRTWDWYLLMQWHDGASFGAAGTNGAPGKIQGTAGVAAEGDIGISVATAFTALGVSANPWRGTILNDGTDYKGSAVGGGGAAVWVAPALGTVNVWPRSNNTGGTFTAQKENTAGLIEASGDHRRRIHVLADSDCLAILQYTLDIGALSGFWLVAPYTPLSGLVATSPLAMLHATTTHVIVRPTNASSYGTTVGTSTREGGVFSVIDGYPKIAAIQCRAYDIPDSTVFTPPAYQPNKQFAGKYVVECPVAVYVNEAANQGLVGFLDDFVRATALAPNEATLDSKSRLVVGDETGPDYAKWTFPWDGVTADPGAASTRLGVTF
jgi:hypothetical protein